MNELALFAGAGGGILGGKLLGWTTVGAVEIEKYPREVLLQRQRDGILNPFPIWDDITTFDGRPWKGAVDIISGGFPCQDISAAGKGKGIDGERSGLWQEMRRVVYEVRPRFVFAENSPLLTSRGLGTVLGGLSEMGYNARWCVLGGDDIEGWTRRKRIWILAFPAEVRSNTDNKIKKRVNYKESVWVRSERVSWEDAEESWFISNGYAVAESNDVAEYVDEFKALGNGQIPAVAATAFVILSEGLIYKEQELF